MQNLGINPVDLGVIAILAISGLLAFFRGFVKEVLAVVGWVGAAIATLQLFPIGRNFARQFVQTELLADAAAGASIFIVSLLILSIISGAIAKSVRNSSISAVDRSLGFVFGLARGAVVVCLAYLLVIAVLPVKEQPPWLRQARVLPLVEWGTSRILQLVPEQFRPNLIVGGDATPISATPPTAVPPPKGKSAAPEAVPLNPLPTTPDKGGQTGYKPEDRQGLEQILRGQQPNSQ